MRVFLPLAVLAALTPFAWQYENRRGRDALEHEMQLLREAGEPSDWRKDLREPVPDAENFGATPALHGLADLPRETLIRSADGSKFDTSVWRLPLNFHNAAFWKDARQYFAGAKGYTVDPAIPDDVRAVFRALDKAEPLFRELSAAATRRHSLFTPSPQERLHRAPASAIAYPKHSAALSNVATLLSLRVHAAINCGDEGEALRMERILRRMDEAWLTYSYQVGSTPPLNDQIVSDGLMRHIWRHDALDKFAAILASRDPAASALTEWRALLVSDLAFGAYEIESLKSRPLRELSNWERWLSMVPEGWLLQGRAWKIRSYRDRFLLPLKHGGIESLADGRAGLRPADKSHWRRYQSGWLPAYEQDILSKMISDETTRRLLLPAMHAEKHRLRSGRYPSSAAEFSTGNHTPLPLDWDAKPVRIVFDAFGGKILFYSVGSDLKDDTSGKWPSRSTSHTDCWLTNSDFILQLVVPTPQPP